MSKLLFLLFKRGSEIKLPFFLILLLCNAGCVYRFSNAAMSPPPGISSIAIEGIYDTSFEPAPHEFFWRALQESFAANGRLKIENQSRADALVRAHITTVKSSPTGTASRSKVNRDPKTSETISPSELKKLTRASSWAVNEQLQLAVTIEIYNLHSGKVIFSSNYSDQEPFKSHRSGDQSLLNTHFLLFEESNQAKFKQLSKRIADKAVADFFLQQL